MNGLILLCFFALFCAILAKISAEISPRFKPLLLLGAGTVFLLVFIGWIVPLVEKMKTLAEKTTVPDFFLILIKAMGLSLIVSITSSFCRDLGEDKIAEKLEICGKGAILSLSLPIFNTVLNWIEELVS